MGSTQKRGEMVIDELIFQIKKFKSLIFNQIELIKKSNQSQ